MKGLFRIIGVVCTANVLALAGLVGWMFNSDRLDMDRVAEIRTMLSETITESAARAEAERAEQAAAVDAAAQEARFNVAPVSAEQQLEARRAESDIALMSVQRMRRAVEDLQRQLDRQRRALDMERGNLERDRGAFAAMREQIASQEGNAQFQRALVVVSQSPPEAAKAVLQKLLERGDEAQTVAYLDALEDRKRTAVLNQWIDDGQADVALRLLEALRTRGIEPLESGGDPA